MRVLAFISDSDSDRNNSGGGGRRNYDSTSNKSTKGITTTMRTATIQIPILSP
jgi:hypothetical protein